MIPKQYKRYFTIDQRKPELKYYETDESTEPKKTMDLTGANAFLVHRKTWDDEGKDGTRDRADEWHDDDQEYRVGIQMKGRGMKPVYCYADIHDAKFLEMEVNRRRNPEAAARQKSLVKAVSLLH